jgi:hypothetical protein
MEARTLARLVMPGGVLARWPRRCGSSNGVSQKMIRPVGRISVSGNSQPSSGTACAPSTGTSSATSATNTGDAAANSGSATPACSPWPRWPNVSAYPLKPSRYGTTPGLSPDTPSTTKANASARHPALTRQPGPKDANSANDAPLTTRNPAEMSGPTTTVTTKTTTEHPASTRKGAVCSPRFHSRHLPATKHRLDPGVLKHGIEQAGEFPSRSGSRTAPAPKNA